MPLFSLFSFLRSCSLSASFPACANVIKLYQMNLYAFLSFGLASYLQVSKQVYSKRWELLMYTCCIM